MSSCPWSEEKALVTEEVSLSRWMMLSAGQANVPVLIVSKMGKMGVAPSGFFFFCLRGEEDGEDAIFQFIQTADSL